MFGVNHIVATQAGGEKHNFIFRWDRRRELFGYQLLVCLGPLPPIPDDGIHVHQLSSLRNNSLVIRVRLPPCCSAMDITPTNRRNCCCIACPARGICFTVDFHSNCTNRSEVQLVRPNLIELARGRYTREGVAMLHRQGIVCKRPHCPMSARVSKLPTPIPASR